jgi:cysteine-rich repeat protein
MRRSVCASLLLAAAMVAVPSVVANAGVAPLCGNGTIDGGETCDDGNLASGDCCSPTCTTEFPSACDDGDPCNGPDACTAFAFCGPEVEPVCDIAAAKTSLAIDATKGHVSFVWQKGSVPFADLGDPTTEDTDYFLCADDGSLRLGPVLVLEVPGGGTCGTKPCWKTTGKATAPTGYLCKSKEPGVRSISLHARDPGKAKLTLQAKDAVLPALGGVVPPVRARLSNGPQCWEQIFFEEQIQTNDGARFKAKRKGIPVS